MNLKEKVGDIMKINIRELCLVLDLECKKVLPLLAMNSEQLDIYIYRKFEDSNAIRKHFKSSIDVYLNNNKDYLENIYKKTGRKTEGSIVILELNDSGFSSTRKSVLYRSGVMEIGNFLTVRSRKEALSKEDFIFYLLNSNNSFLSQYEINILKNNYKRFSKKDKEEFLYHLFEDLEKRCFLNTDKIREFYNILKNYKPKKEQIIEESITMKPISKVEKEEIEEIDPDKIHFDIPAFQPVENDKMPKEEETGYSLKYTYKPYHRK